MVLKKVDETEEETKAIWSRIYPFEVCDTAARLQEATAALATTPQWSPPRAGALSRAAHLHTGAQ